MNKGYWRGVLAGGLLGAMAALAMRPQRHADWREKYAPDRSERQAERFVRGISKRLMGD